MSLHQVHLRGGGRPRGDRPKVGAVRSYARGEMDLVTALGASPAAMKALRRQAEAFHASGHYEECLDLLLGLGTLDDVEPQDAAMMAECFWALGDEESARTCADLYEQILDEWELALEEVRAKQ